MDLCHLKNAELETKQKYKGRVVLRGDIVEDDSGSYAVFTEQASWAWQMTAAKVMEIISRLPGCAGQAADAVSAYTQVKTEDAPRLLHNSIVKMSRCMDTSSTTQVAQILVAHWRPSGSSWTKLLRSHQLHSCRKDCCSAGTWIPVCRPLVEKTMWGSSIRTWMGKIRIWNVCLFIEDKDYSYRCTWMTSKWRERNRISLPCGRYWWRTLTFKDKTVPFMICA